MWYRTYLNKINTKDFEKFIKSSKKELFEKYKEENESFEDFYFSLRDLWKRIFEFWKDIFEIWEDVSFKHKEVEKMYDESYLRILKKEDIIEIIEIYREKVKSYYQELLDWIDYFWEKLPEEERQRRIKNLLENKIWEHSEKTKHYNLEKWQSLTKSRTYEYNIFELIRIYREFDEENEILFYYWS